MGHPCLGSLVPVKNLTSLPINKIEKVGFWMQVEIQFTVIQGKE